MRYPNAIEIYVNIDLLNEQTINYLRDTKNIDFEYNQAKDKWTVWIHDDGNFQITHETLNYLLTLMFALLGVFNNRTKQDHLDLFIEIDKIDEFGVEIPTESGVIKYKNIRASELQTVDLSKIKLKRELNDIR